MMPIVLFLVGNLKKNIHGSCEYLSTVLCTGKPKISDSIVQDMISEIDEISYGMFFLLRNMNVRYPADCGLDGRQIYPNSKDNDVSL